MDRNIRVTDESNGSLLRAGGARVARRHVPRYHAGPALIVPVAASPACLAEQPPAAMPDVAARPAIAVGREPPPQLRRGVTDQPLAYQPAGRLPRHHRPPRELPAVRRLLVDPAAGARLDHQHRIAAPANRMRRHRPPHASAGRPQLERPVHRAPDPEAITQRPGHHYRGRPSSRGPGALSASSRNRAIASPHTSSTYACNAPIPR